MNERNTTSAGPMTFFQKLINWFKNLFCKKVTQDTESAADVGSENVTSSYEEPADHIIGQISADLDDGNIEVVFTVTSTTGVLNDASYQLLVYEGPTTASDNQYFTGTPVYGYNSVIHKLYSFVPEYDSSLLVLKMTSNGAMVSKQITL